MTWRRSRNFQENILHAKLAQWVCCQTLPTPIAFSTTERRNPNDFNVTTMDPDSMNDVLAEAGMLLKPDRATKEMQRSISKFASLLTCPLCNKVRDNNKNQTTVSRRSAARTRSMMSRTFAMYRFEWGRCKWCISFTAKQQSRIAWFNNHYFFPNFVCARYLINQRR